MKLKTKQSLFCEIVAIISISQMRKLELSKVKQLAYRHIGSVTVEIQLKQ